MAFLFQPQNIVANADVLIYFSIILAIHIKVAIASCQATDSPNHKDTII